MAIKLYTYWRSSAAYRVRIALNLKGIDYEAVPVSLRPGDDEHRRDEYRAINPQMLVPFFDDGKVAIGQSMATSTRPIRIFLCYRPRSRFGAKCVRSATRSRAMCTLLITCGC
jgi:hypothetical protein